MNERTCLYINNSPEGRRGIKPFHIEPESRGKKLGPPKNKNFKLFGTYDSAEKALRAAIKIGRK